MNMNKSDLLDKDIRDAGFSNRVTNALTCAGLNTVRDVINTPLDKLMMIHNFGQACLMEFFEFVSENNIGFENIKKK